MIFIFKEMSIVAAFLMETLQKSAKKREKY